MFTYATTGKHSYIYEFRMLPIVITETNVVHCSIVITILAIWGQYYIITVKYIHSILINMNAGLMGDISIVITLPFTEDP